MQDTAGIYGSDGAEAARVREVVDASRVRDQRRIDCSPAPPSEFSPQVVRGHGRTSWSAEHESLD
jgi:hypothetical protein